MNTHDHLIQGSQQWLAHRRAHFNASDAPAMMGCSPYKTRTQFLHEMHTGLVPEVDAATQRRFDDGHRFEALARPLAAAIIGEDLFPVTGTEGKLSASFDGLTMGEDVAFEHKSLNDDLRTVLELIDKGKYTARDLPDHYRIQMEQQCMVAGCGRVLFMASKWSGDELIEERHCWYESDAAMAAEIRAGWAQFEIDLFAYTPTEVVAPTAAASIESLPAVSVRMNGSLAVVSNLDLFGVKLRAFVDKIDMQPSTDQAFADAEAAVKTLGNAEDALIQAEAAALAQTASVEEMRRTVADYVSLARSTRLLLEKVVKARKEQIRVEIVNEGRAALSAHLDALNVRLGKSYMPSVAADFAGAIKGKRTIDSLRDAVNTTLANAKIEANAIADKIQINLTMLRETAKDHAFLFADTAQIVLKENADFILLVDSRIAAHKTAEAAKEEALRERLRQEELARIERERVAAERAAEAKKIADDAAIQAAIQVEQRAKEHATAAAIAAATAAVTQPTGPRLAQLADVQMPLMPHYDEPLRIIPETQPSGPPTLKLGTIAERLGFALSADFLRSLGFEPAGKVGAHGVYHEASFPLICQALVAHIELAQAKRFAA